MILIIQHPKDGPVFIEYAASVERAKARVTHARELSPVRLQAHLIPGGRDTLALVQKALKPYQIRDSKWYRRKKARPVVRFAAAARRDRNFDTLGWARKQTEKRNQPAREAPVDPVPHITQWAAEQALAQRQEADKALDNAEPEQNTAWTGDY
jgi:hypothetical protein